MFSQIISYFTKKRSYSHKIVRSLQKSISSIQEKESYYKNLSDEALQHQTVLLRARYAQGETLDMILEDAFATCREASSRVLGMRPFDVQLCGAMILHKGMIAEMKTGEGKTLVASLATYLNALAGKGVHVVTVNDYLAKRDAEIMGKLYTFLGLSVGCVVNNMPDHEKRAAYQADITYGTNNEFGFDYLRDNMKLKPEEMYQRPFFYAIVDEVDSILIDEARTPLIISGPADDASDLYEKVDALMYTLTPTDYEKEEKSKSVSFTDSGYEKMENLLKKTDIMKGDQLFQPINLMLVHHLNQALKAHIMFHRDVDYIVHDGEVVLVDEHTGRMMIGRRYSDGLHQAIEAKEKVMIEVENQTLASITFQNYFRMYPKLSGMTGTAETEAHEFQEIYNLPVVVVPTNRPILREDWDDEIFATFAQKEEAIIAQVKDCYKRGQPILVGTSSIEKSERFSFAFTQAGIPHNVLNARQHEREASIIAEAGMPGAVTIATNMAGRGTDIKLGGNREIKCREALIGIEDTEEQERIVQKVMAECDKAAEEAKKAGGLFVLGTERHESRRIDNQLRGRSGRQGDPGTSKFFISLEDDLMRIFGPNLQLMQSLIGKNPSNERMTHPWLTRAIKKAQEKVEAYHFETRKNLLKYANVLDQQRKAVYETRYALLLSENIEEKVHTSLLETVTTLFTHHAKNPQKDTAIMEGMSGIFALSHEEKSSLRAPLTLSVVHEAMKKKYEELCTLYGTEHIKEISKNAFLRTLDKLWIQHLNAIDHLRTGIYLQAYGQKDPLNEYKHEAFILFKAMIEEWQHESLHTIFAYVPEQERVQENSIEETQLNIEQLLHKFTHQSPEMEKLLATLQNTFQRALAPDEETKNQQEDVKVISPRKNNKNDVDIIMEKMMAKNDEKPSQNKPKKVKKVQEKGEKEIKKVRKIEKNNEKNAVDADKSTKKRSPKASPTSNLKRKKSPSSQVSDTISTQEKQVDGNSKEMRRNDLCYCGSGKRYKHCHGAL